MSVKGLRHLRKLDKKSKEFKQLETQLDVADILLIRDNSKANLFARGIRRITKSYWNHTAFVFTNAKKYPLFSNVIIVEALAGGIELHKIQRYTSRPDKYDLGVKRMPGLNIADRRMVRGYMMQNVGVPYNYPQILKILISFISGDYKEYFLKNNAFICSGFIQRAFYEAFNKDKQVLFKNISGKNSAETLINYTTPKDVAVSDVTEWVYNKHC